MNKPWERFLRAPADEGAPGGGTGEQAAIPASGGAAQAPDGGNPGGQAAPPGGQPARTSILDLASKAAAPGDGKQPEGKAAEWKAPDTVPEHLRGTDANDTLDKVVKAYAGARAELSRKGTGGLEGTVPKDLDGYKIEVTGDDDKVGKELTSEASKPIVDAYRKAAKELGIPDKAFANFMRKGMEYAAEAGIPIGVTDEEAQTISADAEMAELTKIMGGPKEANTVISTVQGYAQRLIDRGLLSEQDMAEFRVMCGTAQSAAIMYKIVTGEFGQKPIPPAIPGDGKMDPTQAYAAYEAAKKLPEGSERDLAITNARRAMEKAYGDTQGIAVKSRVL